MNEKQFSDLLKSSKGRLFILVIDSDRSLKTFVRSVKNNSITFKKKKLPIPLEYIYALINENSSRIKPVIVLSSDGLPIRLKHEA